MIKNSLSSKITAVFIFSMLLLCMLFFLLDKYQNEKDLEIMKERQLQSINYIFIIYRNNLSPHGVNEYFSNFGLSIVKNQNLKRSVLKKGVVIFQKKSDLGDFSSIKYNERYYLYIDNMITNILLESNYQKRSTNSLWIVFGFALIILISIYISILNSISPLKELRSQIRKFASGELKIDCKSDKEDEIAEVANEFDRAADKLRHLIQSRQLFLRTIMHELKTPIGKGRIVSEMLTDEKAKKRLIGIFERLDLLIREFSKIEQIVSKNYSLQVKEYRLVEVIDSAIDMLMLEDDKKDLHVKVDVSALLSVKVDFESFSLAIKNLLDNAIKYSDNQEVYVKIDNNKLIIENTGKEFKVDIEEYYKPFVSGSSEVKHGLGLGLYIVKNILKLNDFDLNYEYINNTHKFSIDLG
ncbi:ArsS family sensor histidine kinase [Sulfurospirillum arcachonense]|uniref:ArsS family sensor histidine kinase n=1 Tax=Sulfurospirillum arcachonense TaxID=57666 RepID=UPI0004B07859|nr:ArsS family sensor histidine kinase [Sulfurospirillum arcachonense]